MTCVQVTACATYLVFQKTILGKYPSTLITFIYYSIGSAFTALSVGVYAFAYGISPTDMTFNGSGDTWLGIAYTIIFTTVFAWNAYTFASQFLSPSVSTIFMSLQPVFTAVLMYVIFMQQVTVAQCGGGLLVAGGMYITVACGAHRQDSVASPLSGEGDEAVEGCTPSRAATYSALALNEASEADDGL